MINWGLYDKKKIFVIVMIVIIAIGAIIGINLLIKSSIIKNGDNAVILNDYTNFIKHKKLENVKLIKELNEGDTVKLIKTYTDKNNVQWSKIGYKNKIGYVKSENVGKYNPQNSEKVLMSDVSKFNVIYEHFTTFGEYAAFIAKHNFTYVYIRAGGRGYGDEGNFYEDPNYQMFIDACEYLKIPYGFYFLEEALNFGEVDEEIEFIEEFLKKNKTEMCKLPVALDIEKHEGGRAESIWETRVYIVNEMLYRMQKRGIDAIVYSNAKLASQYLSGVNAKLWLAYYPTLKGKIPDYWYSDTDQEGAQNLDIVNKMIAWQFTEAGVGNNIDKNVDVNLVINEYFKQFVNK